MASHSVNFLVEKMSSSARAATRSNIPFNELGFPGQNNIAKMLQMTEAKKAAVPDLEQFPSRLPSKRSAMTLAHSFILQAQKESPLRHFVRRVTRAFKERKHHGEHGVPDSKARYVFECITPLRDNLRHAGGGLDSGQLNVGGTDSNVQANMHQVDVLPNEYDALEEKTQRSLGAERDLEPATCFTIDAGVVLADNSVDETKDTLEDMDDFLEWVEDWPPTCPSVAHAAKNNPRALLMLVEDLELSEMRGLVEGYFASDIAWRLEFV